MGKTASSGVFKVLESVNLGSSLSLCDAIRKRGREITEQAALALVQPNFVVSGRVVKENIVEVTLPELGLHHVAHSFNEVQERVRRINYLDLCSVEVGPQWCWQCGDDFFARSLADEAKKQSDKVRWIVGMEPVRFWKNKPLQLFVVECSPDYVRLGCIDGDSRYAFQIIDRILLKLVAQQPSINIAE